MIDIRKCTDAALFCKDYGHWWDDYRKHGKFVSMFEDARTSLCETCSTMRHTAYDLQGKAQWHIWDYSPEYEAVKSFSKSEARLERMRRQRHKKTTVIRGGRGKGHLRVAG